MAKYSKIIAGHKAKNSGRRFESDLMQQAKIDGIGFEQIPSGCIWRRTPRGVVPIPVKTPFDFMMFKNGKAVFFDAKSTDGVTFPYSMLNQNQVKSLAQIAKHDFKCGYLVKFDGIGFYWFPIEKLLGLKRRESLKPLDGQSLSITPDTFSLLALFL